MSALQEELESRVRAALDEQEASAWASLGDLRDQSHRIATQASLLRRHAERAREAEGGENDVQWRLSHQYRLERLRSLGAHSTSRGPRRSAPGETRVEDAQERAAGASAAGSTAAPLVAEE